jgi:hypothetical protein
MISRQSAEVAATSALRSSAALWARAERFLVTQARHPIGGSRHFATFRKLRQGKMTTNDDETPTKCLRNIDLFRAHLVNSPSFTPTRRRSDEPDLATPSDPHMGNFCLSNVFTTIAN